MFQYINPGLSLRFPISEAFEFEDFTDDELNGILEMKLKQQAYNATNQAKRMAIDVLRRARNHLNFGNAGEVDILLNSAKARHQQHRSAKKDAITLVPIDMDPDFDRGQQAATKVRILFTSVVGCDKEPLKFQAGLRTALYRRERPGQQQTISVGLDT